MATDEQTPPLAPAHLARATGTRGSGIREVARHAGVSIATVSRVFNNAGSVRPGTLDKIMSSASLLGYEPSSLGRNLVRRRSYLIGLIVPNISVPLYGAMLHGIEDVLGRHDMKALLASSLDDRATEARVARGLMKHSIDGGIVINSRVGKALPTQRGSAWVHITPEIVGLDEHRVDLDNEEGGRLAAREFLAAGRREFGYVGAPGLESTERERGYAQELALAGHSYRAVPGDYSEESGYAAGLALLTGALGAVFVAGDLMAAGVLRALHQGGREVPGDVAVIGFDDALIASLLYPRLSTIHQPAYQMGAAAAQMTLDLIGRLPAPPVTFRPHLVRRESTSAPDPDSS